MASVDLTGARKLTVRSMLYVLSDFFQMGVGFLLLPIYTAYLTPADYGVLSVANTISGILAILYLYSFGGVFSRFYYDIQAEQQRRSFFGSNWLFLFLYALILSLILEFVSRFTGSIGFRDVPYNPYLRIVVWTVFLNSVALIFPKSLFIARGQAWKYVLLNIVPFLISISFSIYFIVFKNEGVLGNLKANLIGAILIVLPSFIVIIKNIRFSFRLKHIKTALAFTLPVLPHLLSLWVLNLSDRLILQYYVDLDDVGIYSFGYQIGAILEIFALSISNAITPYYYETANKGSDAKPALSKLATYYLLLLAWIGVGIVGMAQDVIRLIASRPAYFEAHQVVPWVVLGALARGYYFVFVAALYYAKRLKALPFITIGSALGNIILNLMLVPIIGYMAAAITTFLTYAIQAAVMYWFAQRAYALNYESRRLTLLTLLAIGWGLALYWFSLPYLWLDLALKAILALAFPLGLLVLNFFTHEEVNVLYHLKTALKGALRVAPARTEISE